MKYRFTCDCNTGEGQYRKFTTGLVNAWECWAVDQGGELIALDDSGNDGWEGLICVDCDQPVFPEYEDEVDESSSTVT